MSMVLIKDRMAPKFLSAGKIIPIIGYLFIAHGIYFLLRLLLAGASIEDVIPLAFPLTTIALGLGLRAKKLWSIYLISVFVLIEAILIIPILAFESTVPWLALTILVIEVAFTVWLFSARKEFS